ncbi:MAG TPA: DUF4886 domain-containing protein [Brumimicrobium sp.]|nr:DUF4886 domain-containing protein [Brumimicrobium sp.]
MKKQIFVIAALFISTISISQTEKKVLFIGNSYTGSNDLPKLVSNLAQADGNSLNYQAYSPGGKLLSQHLQDATTLNYISSEAWNFVVLQEQSQLPSFPASQVESDFYPYAEALTERIRDNNPCSIPLFFNTWGRRTGDPQWEGINTFEKMNIRLYNAYEHITEETSSMISPVGIGFAHVKNDPTAVVDFNNLYDVDGSHPSIHGSYLAACIFNNIIFSSTSLENTYIPSGMNQAEAAYLQFVADRVVYEVDSVRIDFTPLTENDFTFELTDNTISLTPVVTEGDFVSWNFGDGNSSQVEEAVYIYQVGGSYNVQLVTANECYTGTVTKIVDISMLGLNEETTSSFKVYPNPSIDGRVFVENKGKPYSVYTVLGEEIYTGSSENIQLAKGVYIFQQNDVSRKLIVN